MSPRCEYRNPREDVPVRVRQVVVAVQIRHTAITSPVVQVAKGEGNALSSTYPMKFLMIILLQRGDAPLCRYAANSPRLPFGESRARMTQVGDDKALSPYKDDKPPKPGPLVR